LRIEWSKAFARVRRWGEETRLLDEEVVRLPLSLEHLASDWDDRVKSVPVGSVPFELAEGAMAYGLKQAAMY
ncbi:hypothetical protein DFH06DRAFT_909810, partial [Mycena polygramma]